MWGTVKGRSASAIKGKLELQKKSKEGFDIDAGIIATRGDLPYVFLGNRFKSLLNYLCKDRRQF